MNAGVDGIDGSSQCSSEFLRFFFALYTLTSQQLQESTTVAIYQLSLHWLKLNLESLLLGLLHVLRHITTPTTVLCLDSHLCK